MVNLDKRRHHRQPTRLAACHAPVSRSAFPPPHPSTDRQALGSLRASQRRRDSPRLPRGPLRPPADRGVASRSDPVRGDPWTGQCRRHPVPPGVVTRAKNTLGRSMALSEHTDHWSLLSRHKLCSYMPGFEALVVFLGVVSVSVLCETVAEENLCARLHQIQHQACVGLSPWPG